MTCRSMQVAMLMLTLWVVLRTGEPEIQQKCAGDEGRAGRHQHQSHEARLDLRYRVGSGRDGGQT